MERAFGGSADPTSVRHGAHARLLPALFFTSSPAMKLASQLRSLCNISEKPDGPCNEAVATTLVDVPSDVLVDGIFAVDAIELRGLA
eukprot:413716-Prymnesium_polylepis.3